MPNRGNILPKKSFSDNFDFFRNYLSYSKSSKISGDEFPQIYLRSSISLTVNYAKMTPIKFDYTL